MFHKFIAEKMAELKWTRHDLAEKSNLPYDTVKRIVSGKTLNPTIDTLDRIANAMGCSVLDILTDTRTVVGTKTMVELQEEIDALKKDIETLKAEKELALASNAILTDENKTLNQKIELLNMQNMYKDEIIALHKIIEHSRE